MIKKRIISYVIDIMIILLSTSLIYSIFNTNPEHYIEIYNDYINTSTDYFNQKATEEDVINAEHEMALASKNLQATKISITIIYFSILPFFTKGQTIGKKITKIKVVSTKHKELSAGSMFIRGIIVSLVLIDIINFLTLIYCNQSTWYNITTIINSIIYILYIILLEFVILRKDKRSLHDLISNTKVIEAK